ncbi:MAG TPA: hypothetical protein VK747_13020 [Blastocatellia bacterium]|nr:hypothetical protein [Blastocatellia bacterium]
MSATIASMLALTKEQRKRDKGEAIPFIVGMCLIPFSIAIVAYLKHAPWPVWMFLALFTQMAIVLPLFIMAARQRHAATEDREKIIDPIPVLSLKLTPHNDKGSSIYLEVGNLGDTVNLSAQLRILGRSPSKLFKTYPFCGQWKSETATVDVYEQQLESYVGDVQLESNKSRLLTIASIVSITSLADQEMTIEGIDEESIVWDSSRRSQELPYFLIQVNLKAKGYQTPLLATYKVGPKTADGPFDMMEVTE